MSIHDILNDINDGVTDNNEISQEAEQASLENARTITTVATGVSINLGKLDTGVIDKFNTLYKRCLLRKTISKMTKVDRSIAIEAMATLPSHNPINEAKLTSTPSVINKKILDEIVFSGKDELPSDLHEFILDTFSMFNEELLAEIKDLLSFVSETNSSIKEIVNNKVKTSIIMVGNESHNLLSDSLLDLSLIDDSKVMYEKYEGELNKRISAILNNDFYEFNKVIKEISSGAVGKGFSIVDILGDLSLVEIILTGISDNIQGFINIANLYIDQNSTELTGAANDTVEKLQSVISSAETYNKLTGVINTDSVFLEAVVDYLNFID